MLTLEKCKIYLAYHTDHIQVHGIQYFARRLMVNSTLLMKPTQAIPLVQLCKLKKTVLEITLKNFKFLLGLNSFGESEFRATNNGSDGAIDIIARTENKFK